jgi:YggT family protein
MVLLGNIILGIAVIVDFLLVFFMIAIFGYIIISWVNADRYNPIVRAINAAVEPLMQPVRRYIKPLGGVLDLAPLVIMALILFLRTALVPSITYYGQVIQH